VRAIYQDDLKRRLAFSTISQVSYIVLGAAMVGPIATMGGVVHLVHQGLMKITLFFAPATWPRRWESITSASCAASGRRMPFTMAAFTVGALGMIGMPPMAGFISKWYLGSGAVDAGQAWVVAVLAASTVLNAVYFLPVLYAAWLQSPENAWPHAAPRGRFETRLTLLLPPVLTALFTVLTGLLAGMPFSPLDWVKLIVSREYGL
jgi:formate hydrogenlyase subunit 3/multisubunit Na+/H+ antiporter MnhD subunit